MMKLYLHSPIRLHGVLFNYFSTETMEFTQTEVKGKVRLSVEEFYLL
jgi:hypothetical protein